MLKKRTKDLPEFMLDCAILENISSISGISDFFSKENVVILAKLTKKNQ